MGRVSRHKKKIKACDPFSKTGGVYQEDLSKFNAPPPKGYDMNDDSGRRVSSRSLIIMRPKNVAQQGGGKKSGPGSDGGRTPGSNKKKRKMGGGGDADGDAPDDDGETDAVPHTWSQLQQLQQRLTVGKKPSSAGVGASASAPAGAGGSAPPTAAGPGAGAAAAGGAGAGSSGAPGAGASTDAAPDAAAKPVRLVMLPGESFQQFSRRVNALARERLAQQTPKMTHPSVKRKEFYDKKKQHKRDKGMEEQKKRVAKAALLASGNAGAIKRARQGGLDYDVAEEVSRRTDVVKFGERVEAPPALPSLSFFDKMKKRWSDKAERERGMTSGAGPTFREHAS